MNDGKPLNYGWMFEWWIMKVKDDTVGKFFSFFKRKSEESVSNLKLSSEESRQWQQ